MEYALYRLLVRVLPMGPSQIQLRRHGIGHVETYEVLDHELNQLEKEGCDVGFDFQVAQFSLTTALSFLVGLILSPPPDGSPKTFVVLVVIVVVGFFMAAVFGIHWYRSRSAFAATIRTIKERQIGPVGDEDHQLKPAELASLQPIEAPRQEKAEP
jgi:hypothetical protein